MAGAFHVEPLFSASNVHEYMAWFPACIVCKNFHFRNRLEWHYLIVSDLQLRTGSWKLETMPVSLSLSGKAALISGGSRGIGAATVRLFTQAGAKVAFSYRKARAQAEALAKECGEANCYAIGSDLDGPDSARVLIGEAVKHFGRIDILVANHGVWPAEDIAIDKMTDEQWRSTILNQSGRGIWSGQTHGCSNEGAVTERRYRRAHCAHQFHQRAAWRGVSLRLLSQ